MTNEQLLQSITIFQKKVKKLERLGPGAFMAAAANNSHLRRLQAEADARGLGVAA